MMDGRNERPVPNLHSSALTKREAICVLAYLPVHVAFLPLLLGRLIAEEHRHRRHRAEALLRERRHGVIVGVVRELHRAQQHAE